MNEPTMSYEQVLEQEGRLVAINSGTSMMPLLRQGRDIMVIDKKGDDRCKKYDAVLYKSNGRYVLHRVVEVRENDYVILGDNCRIKEYGVTDEQIIGVLTAVLRSGKRELKCDGKLLRIYAHLWVDLYPIKAVLLRFRELASAVKRRVKNRKK